MAPGALVRVAWEAVAPGEPRRERAWALIRELVPGASISNPCPRCGGPHGPVRLGPSGFVASVTYAGNFAIIGVARQDAATSLGIDGEPAVDPRRDAVGLGGVLGPGRTADVRAWTRVEAALKADGRGLRVDPGLVEVTARAGGWTARVPGREQTLRGLDLGDGPPGVVLSAAMVTAEAAEAASGRSRR